jgi:hypothetical protein
MSCIQSAMKQCSRGLQHSSLYKPDLLVPLSKLYQAITDVDQTLLRQATADVASWR